MWVSQGHLPAMVRRRGYNVGLHADECGGVAASTTLWTTAQLRNKPGISSGCWQKRSCAASVSALLLGSHVGCPWKRKHANIWEHTQKKRDEDIFAWEQSATSHCPCKPYATLFACKTLRINLSDHFKIRACYWNVCDVWPMYLWPTKTIYSPWMGHKTEIFFFYLKGRKRVLYRIAPRVHWTSLS